MRYALIVLIIMLAVYITGCAHNSARTPSVAPLTLSSPQHKDPPSMPKDPNPPEHNNKTSGLSNEDLDTLYAEAKAGTVHVADPIAPFNRAMYHFNDKFYFWVLKPVTKGYKYVVPAPLRLSVKNFFDNLIMPVRLVNCVLQGKFHSAGTEVTRFVINSTAGMLGFADPADNYPQLKTKDEDLGQTLGAYGIGNGFYIVWPLVGPSTLRDTVGLAGDQFLNPVAYVRPAEAAFGITAYKRVNTTSFHIGDYESLKESAIDPYSAIRDAYIQSRAKKVRE
jgi:phospholipid-binding lipoprotein MlaA